MNATTGLTTIDNMLLPVAMTSLHPALHLLHKGCCSLLFGSCCCCLFFLQACQLCHHLLALLIPLLQLMQMLTLTLR
jgi:hypothetical protein